MLKVGLTGGIGSGKSLIAEMFKLLGVPVIHADVTAKYLMEHDEALKAAISKLFGEEVYENGRLNRPFLASLVFKNKQRLEALNALVHPATVAYGKKWFAAQKFPYSIKEAAIFFESGTYVEMDKMIGVYAPADLRLKRAMERDAVSEEEIRKRMQHQMNEEEKMSRCDYVIQNDGTKSIIEQVLELNKVLIEISNCK
ncbi:dephospho-CoA kinase [Taibaiella lutea]|uniref:Dephospho-CoA kinase n=1 Tax=Taibaiella lutea TaxID=2608001 RepID=A0A5M6CLQ1_9BACT|nr:dephospho-CoA kinase [Taibaiella lutea]KAA5534912.1 dephospho-CoA kinase [Taibaiella lutea]